MGLLDLWTDHSASSAAAAAAAVEPPSPPADAQDESNLRSLCILAGYLATAALLAGCSIGVVVRQARLRQRRRSNSPGNGGGDSGLGLRAALFACLAALSLATTWYHMFAFFAHSYRAWADAAAVPLPGSAAELLASAARDLLSLFSEERVMAVRDVVARLLGDEKMTTVMAMMEAAAPLKLGPWLSDTSLFSQAWGSAMDTDARFWWTHQIFGLCCVWSLVLGFEGSKRKIPMTWIFMLLGQIVAISFAANLSFLAILMSSSPVSSVSVPPSPTPSVSFSDTYLPSSSSEMPATPTRKGGKGKGSKGKGKGKGKPKKQQQANGNNNTSTPQRKQPSKSALKSTPSKFTRETQAGFSSSTGKTTPASAFVHYATVFGVFACAVAIPFVRRPSGSSDHADPYHLELPVLLGPHVLVFLPLLFTRAASSLASASSSSGATWSVRGPRVLAVLLTLAMAAWVFARIEGYELAESIGGVTSDWLPRDVEGVKELLLGSVFSRNESSASSRKPNIDLNTDSIKSGISNIIASAKSTWEATAAAAAQKGGTGTTGGHQESKALGEIIAAFGEHPAVSSVGWDVVLCWTSLVAWAVLGA